MDVATQCCFKRREFGRISSTLCLDLLSYTMEILTSCRIYRKAPQSAELSTNANVSKPSRVKKRWQVVSYLGHPTKHKVSMTKITRMLNKRSLRFRLATSNPIRSDWFQFRFCPVQVFGNPRLPGLDFQMLQEGNFRVRVHAFMIGGWPGSVLVFEEATPLSTTEAE